MTATNRLKSFFSLKDYLVLRFYYAILSRNYKVEYIGISSIENNYLLLLKALNEYSGRPNCKRELNC